MNASVLAGSAPSVVLLAHTLKSYTSPAVTGVRLTGQRYGSEPLLVSNSMYLSPEWAPAAMHKLSAAP